LTTSCTSSATTVVIVVQCSTRDTRTFFLLKKVIFNIKLTMQTHRYCIHKCIHYMFLKHQTKVSPVMNHSEAVSCLRRLLIQHFLQIRTWYWQHHFPHSTNTCWTEVAKPHAETDNLYSHETEVCARSCLCCICMTLVWLHQKHFNLIGCSPQELYIVWRRSFTLSSMLKGRSHQ